MGATPYLEGFCATYIDWHIRAGSWLYAPLTSIVASVFMCASLLILVWRMASNYRAAYDYSAVSLFASAKERVVQILPVYFWFAQLVCFWFTLTAISLFLPYESEASMVTGHVIYCGHGFMDNFLIVLAYQKSTDGPAVRRTVAVVLFICLVKAILLIVYSDRDLGCGWCSTFFPVPQAGYMDMALAACYVFMCASVYVPSLERFRPRTTILPWILFMAVSYFTVSVAAGMNEARLDVGLCVESVAVYIYAAGYAIILYISFARDSAYWHGFDNRLLNASDGAMGSPMRTKSGSMVLGTPRNHGSVQSALQRLQDLHVVVVPWRELHLGPRLGSGGFGEVFRAKWRTTPVAVKRLYPLPNGGVAASQGHAGREAKALELLVSFGKEASIMQQLRHPNIVMLMGVSATRAGDLVMVTELMDRGSVFDVMAVTGKPLDLYATARVGLHTCRGMAYLHGFNPKIIHRDLKCANLLLDKQWTVKCADFGLSRELMSAATTRVGSVQWAAPEILRGEEYTEKCDVFSFGVCVWECLSGQVPYHGMSPVAVVTKVGTQGMQLSLPAPHTPTSIAYAPPVMAAGGSAPLAPQRGVGGVRGDEAGTGAGAGAAAGAGGERRAGRQKSTSSPAIQVVVQPANTAAAAGAQPIPAGAGAGVAAGHGAGAGDEAAAGAQGTPAVGGHNAGALPAPLAPQPGRDTGDRPPRSGPSRTPSRKRAVMAPPSSSSSQRSRGTSSASESGESESMVIIRRIFRNCVREEPGKRPSFPQLVAAFELMIAKTPRTRLP